MPDTSCYPTISWQLSVDSSRGRKWSATLIALNQGRKDGFMKKYFALALTFVLLFVMAAPAMAADGEDAVRPDALCNGNHLMYVADETNFTWKYVDNETHVYSKTVYHLCSRCKYSEVEVVTSSRGSHSGSVTHAICNGTTQTRYYDCTTCKSEYAKSKRCPGATHSGVCQWL